MAIFNDLANSSVVIHPSPFGSRVFAESNERNSTAQLSVVGLDLRGCIKVTVDVASLPKLVGAVRE
jgi:hypothetical protein